MCALFGNVFKCKYKHHAVVQTDLLKASASHTTYINIIYKQLYRTANRKPTDRSAGGTVKEQIPTLRVTVPVAQSEF